MFGYIDRFWKNKLDFDTSREDYYKEIIKDKFTKKLYYLKNINDEETLKKFTDDRRILFSTNLKYLKKDFENEIINNEIQSEFLIDLEELKKIRGKRNMYNTFFLDRFIKVNFRIGLNKNDYLQICYMRIYHHDIFICNISPEWFHKYISLIYIPLIQNI